MIKTFARTQACVEYKSGKASKDNLDKWLFLNGYVEIYDSAGRVVIDVLPDGNKVYYNYDERDNLSHVYSTFKYYANYDYDDNNTISYFEDSLGYVRNYD
jgi:YD repeat-containing protein